MTTKHAPDLRRASETAAELRRASETPDLERLRHQLAHARIVLNAIGRDQLGAALAEVQELLSKGTIGVYQLVDGTRIPLHLWDAVAITTLGSWRPAHTTEGEASERKGLLR